MPTQTQGTARAFVEAVDGDRVTMTLPGTDYRLDLRLRGTAEPGTRVKGTIEATALRIHAAQGGGRFIEPVWGEPRIVAGRVVSFEAEANRVLVDIAVPIWVTLPEGQDPGVLREGALVNFYVESGTTFTPASGD